MNDRFSAFIFIWLFGFIVLFSLPHGACADVDMSGNLNTRGQAPVAVIDYLTAVTNQSYSVTSKTNNPGFRQSVCVEAYRLSTIAGMSDIQAGSVTVTATLKNGSALDEALLEWYVNDVKMPTRGRTYPFSAVGRSIGKYKVEAKLNENAKAVNIYVVNCSYIIAVQNTGSHTPVEISWNGFYYGNFVGHASWKLKIEPSEACKAKPINFEDNLINNYIGFHANDYYSVISTGKSDAPTPTFNTSDTIVPSKTKEYSLTIPLFHSMLETSISYFLNPDDYILGTFSSVELLPWHTLLFTWSHSSSRNCVTTALDIGSSNGLTVPSSYDIYFGRQGTFDIIYYGNAPCFLYDNM